MRRGILALAVAASCSPSHGGTADALPADAAIGDAFPPNAIYVDPVNGDDTQLGTIDLPFKTLAHAIQVLPSGFRIALEDGTYDAASGEDFDVQTIPPGVVIVAVNDGKAILSGTSTQTALSFIGGGTVIGVELTGFATGAKITTGTVQLTDVTCNATTTCISVPVSAEPPSVALTNVSVTGGTRAGLFASAGAHVYWKGGTIQQMAVGDCFGAVKVTDSTVVLDSVMMLNSDGPAAFALGNASLTIQGATIKDMLNNSTMFDCQSATGVVTSQDPGSVVEMISTTMTRTTYVSMKGALASGGELDVMDGAYSNIGECLRTYGATTARLSVVGGTYTACGIGIRVTEGTATIADVTVAGALNNGIEIESTTAAASLRGSTVTNNTHDGVHCTGSCDLGTAADPGNNTLTGNGTDGFDLSSAPAGMYAAIGNTWRPTTQGSDNNGNYSANTTIPSPGVSCSTSCNYALAVTGQSLELD